MWKESRGQADWVIVTAVDEAALSSARSLALSSLSEVARHHGGASTGLSDHHRHIPGVAHDDLARQHHLGAPLDDYNKLSVFNPDAIEETRYAVGRHSAMPKGHVRYPERDRLLLFHYNS